MTKTQTVTKYIIDEAEWNNSLIPYFLKKRGVLDVERALREFNFTDDEIKQLKDRIKAKRKSKGTKILSSFGEITASFFLTGNKEILLIGLRWPREMFENPTGVDIIGINPRNLDVTYAEVKASETKKPSSIRSQKAKLTNDLLDKRLNSVFLETTREAATKLWIVDLLKEAIREGKLSVDKDTIESIIKSKQKYVRYGFLIHGLVNNEFYFGTEFRKLDEHCRSQQPVGEPCTLKCKKTCPKRNPVHFIDTRISEISNKIDQIIELEFTIVAKDGRVDA